MTLDSLFFVAAFVVPVLLAWSTIVFIRRCMHRKSQRVWLTLLVGNVLILLFLLASVFLAFEIYYRVWYDQTVGNNLTKVSKRWFARHWKLNNANMRDDVDYHPAKPEGMRRITFIGDSFTAAHGVPNVADRFVNRIRKDHPQWQIHMFADNGWETVDQLRALKDLIKRGYELDIVVLVYLFNDIQPYVPELVSVKKDWYREPAHFIFFIEHSYAINTWYYRWRQNGNFQIDGNDYVSLFNIAYQGEPWQRQRQALRDLEALIAGQGGKLFAVTFPWLRRLIDGDEQLHQMHRQLDAFWPAAGVSHLDLIPVLDRHRGRQLVVNRFDTHPSVFAHELVAEAIEDWIVEAVDY